MKYIDSTTYKIYDKEPKLLDNPSIECDDDLVPIVLELLKKEYIIEKAIDIPWKNGNIFSIYFNADSFPYTDKEGYILPAVPYILQWELLEIEDEDMIALCAPYNKIPYRFMLLQILAEFVQDCDYCRQISDYDFHIKDLDEEYTESILEAVGQVNAFENILATVNLQEYYHRKIFFRKYPFKEPVYKKYGEKYIRELHERMQVYLNDFVEIISEDDDEEEE